MTTSEGIILIDSGYDYSAKELITDGLKKLKLEPAQIKYVILTHVHGDRFYGAPYLQKTYNARAIMTEADWNAMTKTNDPAELKPKKDMVATDGMKLTLGDTTLTLYSHTGPHTGYGLGAGPAKGWKRAARRGRLGWYQSRCGAQRRPIFSEHGRNVQNLECFGKEIPGYRS